MSLHRRTWWLVSLALVACIVFVSIIISRRTGRKPSVLMLAITGPPGVESLSFSMATTPTIRRTHEYPHNFVIGKDEYAYQGIINYGDSSSLLSVSWFEPIGVLRTNRAEYLLARGYLVPSSFKYFVAHDGRFEAVPLKAVDSDLWRMDMADGYCDYQYKLWCLSELIEANRSEDALKCLDGYLAPQPRALLLADWAARSSRDVTFSEFLENEICAHNLIECYGDIARIIVALEPGDDPQVMRALAKTAIKLRADEGRQLIDSLRESVRKSGELDDVVSAEKAAANK
jgi:hypothetical protein